MIQELARELAREGTVTPTWLPDGDRFVCRTGQSVHDVVVIDGRTGERRPLLDARHLVRAADILGVPESQLGEVDALEVDSDGAVMLEFGGRSWRLSASGDDLNPIAETEREARARRRPRRVGDYFPAHDGPIAEVPSPSGDRLVLLRDHDLWIRDARTDRETRLTTDGTPLFAWNGGRWAAPRTTWAPDDRHIFVAKTDMSRCPTMPVVHWLAPREYVTDHIYVAAGDPLPRQELYILNTLDGSRVRIETGDEPWYFREVGWSPGSGTEFRYLWLSRDSRTVELRGADPTTGASRTIWRDRAETFVATTIDFFNRIDPLVRPLPDGRILVTSERSGWRHVYEILPGGLRAITSGEFRVEDIVRVDERRGCLDVMARSDPARPYDLHLVRYPLAGGEPQVLTLGEGEHSISYSPSGEVFVDTTSTVSQPPRTWIRGRDGGVLAEPAIAESDRLEEAGWSPIEEVTVMAPDGVTPLRGVLRKPPGFDPTKRYPLVEQIYAAPSYAWAPRTFPEAYADPMLFALAAEGFLVLTLDGRGTPGRSKAFQDVAYRNWGRYEVHEHAAAIRELAASRPYIDLDRVGIFGFSFGGFFTVRAMLREPSLYAAGVALCPVSQLSTMLAVASESYFGGVPAEVPDAYAEADNTLIVDTLQGKLLILHPTSDVNAPFAHTVRLLDAFRDAGKHVDFGLVAEADHGFATQRTDAARGSEVLRTIAYLVEHLRPAKPRRS